MQSISYSLTRLIVSHPKLKAVQDSVLLHDSSQLSRLVANRVLLMESAPSLRPFQRTEKQPEVMNNEFYFSLHQHCVKLEQDAPFCWDYTATSWVENRNKLFVIQEFAPSYIYMRMNKFATKGYLTFGTKLFIEITETVNPTLVQSMFKTYVISQIQNQNISLPILWNGSLQNKTDKKCLNIVGNTSNLFGFSNSNIRFRF